MELKNKQCPTLIMSMNLPLVKSANRPKNTPFSITFDYTVLHQSALPCISLHRPTPVFVGFLEIFHESLSKPTPPFFRHPPMPPSRKESQCQTPPKRPE